MPQKRFKITEVLLNSSLIVQELKYIVECMKNENIAALFQIRRTHILMNFLSLKSANSFTKYIEQAQYGSITLKTI